MLAIRFLTKGLLSSCWISSGRSLGIEGRGLLGMGLTVGCGAACAVGMGAASIVGAVCWAGGMVDDA